MSYVKIYFFSIASPALADKSNVTYYCYYRVASASGRGGRRIERRRSQQRLRLLDSFFFFFRCFSFSSRLSGYARPRARVPIYISVYIGNRERKE